MPIEKLSDQLTSPFSPMLKAIEQISLPMQIFMNPLEKVFKKLSLNNKRCDFLEKSGWLPHYTTPFEWVDFELENFSELMTNFYIENWSDISMQIKKRVLSLPNIDDEAKDTLIAALNIHEQGHYKFVVRALFPEIERLSRQKFRDESNKFLPIASQKELRENLGGVPISGELFVLALYDKINQHLYSEVKSEENLKKLKLDSVPNRHAALHGLVSYNSMQNSLNAIFITDYLLQVLNDNQWIDMAKSGKFLKEEELLRNMEEHACID